MNKLYTYSIFTLILICGIFSSGKLSIFATCASWDYDCQIGTSGGGRQMSINEYFQLHPPPNWVKDPVSGKWGAPPEIPTIATADTPVSTTTETPPVVSTTESTNIVSRGQAYDDYIKESSNYCDSTDRSWAKNNSLVPKIDYPKLNATAVNATITKWSKSKSFSDDEKLRLKYDLDPTRIGEYSGFKTLEVARIAYRTRMNSSFSCAIISSRIRTMKILQEIINKKIYNKESEIHKKLKKEVEKLQMEVNKLTCNLPKTGGNDQTISNTEEITVLVNTTIHQYCQYRFYLGYLDSNISEKLRDIQEIERNIGKGSGTQIPKTTNEWVKIAPRYHLDLSNEITRADTTLPKAISAFQEMDQTYGAHILLTLIYDDYIKLRKALSSYMNISSQLYQKANNAQSTNK